MLETWKWDRFYMEKAELDPRPHFWVRRVDPAKRISETVILKTITYSVRSRKLAICSRLEHVRAQFFSEFLGPSARLEFMWQRPFGDVIGAFSKLMPLLMRC